MRTNKILIGLPISDVQLLLAVSRRIDELSALSRFVSPEELEFPAGIMRDILKEYEDGLQAFYKANESSAASQGVRVES